jgi:hypothetical protein
MEPLVFEPYVSRCDVSSSRCLYSIIWYVLERETLISELLLLTRVACVRQVQIVVECKSGLTEDR